MSNFIRKVKKIFTKKRKLIFSSPCICAHKCNKYFVMTTESEESPVIEFGIDTKISTDKYADGSRSWLSVLISKDFLLENVLLSCQKVPKETRLATMVDKAFYKMSKETKKNSGECTVEEFTNWLRNIK